jgi:hypothetical protein
MVQGGHEVFSSIPGPPMAGSAWEKGPHDLIEKVLFYIRYANTGGTIKFDAAGKAHSFKGNFPFPQLPKPTRSTSLNFFVTVRLEKPHLT